MAVPEDNRFPLEQYRRFYAEEISVSAFAGASFSALVDAFARVPRERFLGPPPWRLFSGSSLHESGYRVTSNVRDLYHDVLVALKDKQSLNNGQPSLIARFISALDLAPGKRAVHIGCGTGYYTAIMAEIVRPNGAVIAIEIEPDLAAQAAVNLGNYPQVKVLNADGSAINPDDLGHPDAILINAGVTHPHPAWVHALHQTGVMVLPLFVGKTLASKEAVAFRVTRQGNRFTAAQFNTLTIYPCTGMCDPGNQALLNASFKSHSLLRVKSLRMEPHPQTDTCIVHAPTFCLSVEAVNK